MAAAKQEARRESIGNFIRLNPTLADNKVANHFIAQRMSKTTVYRVIGRVRAGQDLKTRHGGGKQFIPLTTELREELVEMFDGEVDVTISYAARKLNVGRGKIREWLAIMGIKKKTRN